MSKHKCTIEPGKNYGFYMKNFQCVIANIGDTKIKIIVEEARK